MKKKFNYNMKCTLELVKKDLTICVFIDNICIQGKSHIRMKQKCNYFLMEGIKGFSMV